MLIRKAPSNATGDSALGAGAPGGTKSTITLSGYRPTPVTLPVSSVRKSSAISRSTWTPCVLGDTAVNVLDFVAILRLLSLNVEARFDAPSLAFRGGVSTVAVCLFRLTALPRETNQLCGAICLCGCASVTCGATRAATGWVVPMKTAVETPNRTPSARACRALISRRPDKIALTTDCPPTSLAKSVCLISFESDAQHAGPAPAARGHARQARRGMPPTQRSLP